MRSNDKNVKSILGSFVYTMGNKYISEEIMERDMERKKEWETSRMNDREYKRKKEKVSPSLSLSCPTA